MKATTMVIVILKVLAFALAIADMSLFRSLILPAVDSNDLPLLLSSVK